MSFNIRDVQGISRTLEDFKMIADMIDEADIVIFQELGAKGYNQREEGIAAMSERFQAMIEVYKLYLGNNWEFVLAPEATPSRLGLGAEIPFAAYKKQVNNLSIEVAWNAYHDLGDDKRDMGLFSVTCSNGDQTKSFTIGTVHTSPKCKDGRGLQLTGIGKYAETHTNENFILLGDFNFGYTSTSSCHNEFPGYSGEDYLRQVHDDGKAFLAFKAFSYNGDGEDDDFRTNLNKRGAGHMYDQFLVSNSLAGLMADDGSLTEDCGWHAFSDSNYFEDIMDKEASTQMKGFEKAMKHFRKSTDSRRGKALLKTKEKEILNHHTTVSVASHHISDHKPIWIQFKLF